MLKRYKIGRFTFQFVEGEQPECAVEVVKKVALEAKAAETENKIRKTANKRKAVECK